MTFSRKTLFSVMQVKTRSLHGFHLDPAITFLNHIILIQQELLMAAEDLLPRSMAVGPNRRLHFSAVNTGIGT